MRNEFQKLVDRELSGLCWNERMRQKTLRSLKKEDKPVKKKMTVGMALTLVMVLVGSLALAAGLMFSPRYDQLKAPTTIPSYTGTPAPMNNCPLP